MRGISSRHRSLANQLRRVSSTSATLIPKVRSFQFVEAKSIFPEMSPWRFEIDYGHSSFRNPPILPVLIDAAFILAVLSS
jgi:hypothetical protein